MFYCTRASALLSRRHAVQARVCFCTSANNSTAAARRLPESPQRRERERAGEHEGIDRATQDALDAMLEEKRRRKIYYVPAAATTEASEDRPKPSFLPSRVLRHFLRCTETRLDCLAVMRARIYSRFFSDKPALASSFSPLPKPWSRLFEAPVASGFVAASILILVFYITIMTCHQRGCSGALFSFTLLCKSYIFVASFGWLTSRCFHSLHRLNKRARQRRWWLDGRSLLRKEESTWAPWRGTCCSLAGQLHFLLGGEGERGNGRRNDAARKKLPRARPIACMVARMSAFFFFFFCHDDATRSVGERSRRFQMLRR